MAHQIIVRFLSLPGIMRLGLLILACGATLDLAFHAAPPGWFMNLHYLGQHGGNAHLVTLLGMIMTVVGLPFRRTAVQMAPIAERASNKES